MQKFPWKPKDYWEARTTRFNWLSYADCRRSLATLGPNFINVIVDDDPAIAWDTYIHYREALKAVDLDKKFVGISFAKSFHYGPLQAADMAAFLIRKKAREQFYKSSNDCKLLTDYLFEGTASPRLMQWYTGLWDDQDMVDLANKLGRKNAEIDAVPEVQQNSGATSGSAPLADQGKTASGERTKKAEEI